MTIISTRLLNIAQIKSELELSHVDLYNGDSTGAFASIAMQYTSVLFNSRELIHSATSAVLVFHPLRSGVV